jgi:RHH-type transcriptional regulator, rel operon repressor / antitoxin RelB
MLSIDLDPEIERRLSELAKRSGKSPADFARELIEDDVDDIYTAEARLADPQPTLTLGQVRKELGLDD